MLKKFMVILLSVVLVLTFAVGCSGPKEEGKEGQTSNETEVAKDENKGSEDAKAVDGQNLKIAWVHSNTAADSEQRAKQGFEDYVKEKGYNWDLSISDSGGSGDKLASNIEDAVQRGVDAIIVSMADLRAAKAALEEASKANIKVFAIDSGWVPGVMVDITSNNYAMSAKVSSYLVDKLGGEGGIVVFKMAEHHGVRKRGEVLDVILKENPGIEVLGDHNIDYTNFYEDTQKTMEDYLNKYGKDIKAVWAGWDEPGMAAAAAIEAAGLNRDDIFVVGIDGNGAAVEQMREGSPFSATVAQGFEVMGEKIGELLTEIYVNGKAPEEVITTTTMYVDTPLITNQNLPGEDEPIYLAPDFYSK